MISHLMTRTWWVFLVRGILAILFGVGAYLQPEATLKTLVLLFGAYALTDGILSALSAVSGRHENDHWWLFLFQGVAGVAVGALTLLAPGVTTIALLFYIAVWAIATGILSIVAAVRLRKEIDGEWLLAVAGLSSALFGVCLLTRPGAGALAVLWLIAAFAVLFGIVLVLLAFNAREFAKRLKTAHA